MLDALISSHSSEGTGRPWLLRPLQGVADWWAILPRTGPCNPRHQERTEETHLKSAQRSLPSGAMLVVSGNSMFKQRTKGLNPPSFPNHLTQQILIRTRIILFLLQEENGREEGERAMEGNCFMVKNIGFITKIKTKNPRPEYQFSRG